MAIPHNRAINQILMQITNNNKYIIPIINLKNTCKSKKIYYTNYTIHNTCSYSSVTNYDAMVGIKYISLANHILSP